VEREKGVFEVFEEKGEGLERDGEVVIGVEGERREIKRCREL
jgi:hypothetical protein